MDDTTVLDPRAYDRLRDALRQILDRSKQQARQAAARLAAEAYWEVGRQLHDARLSRRAGYRAQVLEDLASDLDVGVRVLQEAMAFARAYPERPDTSVLGWSHYRELLRVHDPERRALYAAHATDARLTVRGLRTAIHEARLSPPAASEPTDGPAGAPTLERPTEPSYIYRAFVERVVDGDTLLVRIDLGFDVLVRQRLRLAGVDVRAAGTTQGDTATRFVTHQLATSQSVAIRTHRLDLHGRYVAHVFHSLQPQSVADTFRQGAYLNQQLLDEGLARVHGSD